MLSSSIYSGLAFLCDVKRYHATFHIICTGFLFALNKESTAWIAFIYPPNNTSLIKILNVHMQSSYKQRTSEKKKNQPPKCGSQWVQTEAMEFPDGLYVGVDRKRGFKKEFIFLIKQLGRLISYQMRWESQPEELSQWWGRQGRRSGFSFSGVIFQMLNRSLNRVVR